LSSSLEDLLALIRGYCSVLLPAFPEGDTRREDVVQMESAARRAHRLSSLLPGIAQGEAEQSETLDLNALVADLEGIVRRLLGEGIELATDLDPELGHIHGNPVQIERIILNLTTNARDAMRGEGRLTIQTRTAESQADVDQCRRCVMLSVSDTGCGMDDDTLTSAFLPCFTTKSARGGTGLGLSIVREVVDRSDGRIQVHSSPGR
jgi:signal transduction histidine kinase